MFSYSSNSLTTATRDGWVLGNGAREMEGLKLCFYFSLINALETYL